MIIREARLGDASKILQLIHGLADYEKAPEQVVATVEKIEESLFCDAPVAFCLLAEIEDEIVGFAIWFKNYSTWLGEPGIYLEDLYVDSAYRAQGIGTALMKHLAQMCVHLGYRRFQWWVLDWNKPAIDFYQSIGAEPMDEWTVFRLSGNALSEFAKS